MRVLIVEDDAALGLFLQKGLKLEGHDVSWVGDGEAALVHAAEHRPDLIVLDLSLPRKDGTEVLEEMRGRFDDTAVLVLTGRSHVDERVKCLNLGADDCLLKPFSFHELTARCRALLRRRGQCCSRSELLREVWQMSPDAGTNVVDVYVNYLRRKLGAATVDGDEGCPVIETVRGEGYRMAIGRRMVARAIEYPVAAAFAG